MMSLMEVSTHNANQFIVASLRRQQDCPVHPALATTSAG